MHKPKFCGKCGTSLPDNVNFCVECGFPVGVGSASPNEAPQHYESESNLRQSVKRKGSKIKKIGIIAAGIIISLIIMGAIASITAEDKNPPRYEGLTQGQITHIRLIEDQCNQGAMMAYSQGGATVEEIYTKKCNQVIDDKISQFREENTVKNAIETRNVSLCENVPNNLICIKEYALALNEPQVCSSAGHVELSCIQEIAMKYNQIETCDLLEDNTSCIYLFAKSSSDPAICDKATNQNECYSSYLNDRLKPSSVRWTGESDLGRQAIDCRNSTTYNEFDLYACRIEALIGNEIPKEISQDILFNAKVEGYGGLTICKIIDIPQGPAEKSNDQCLASLAVFYNDYSMCDQIKNADYDFRSTCINAIQERNKS